MEVETQQAPSASLDGCSAKQAAKQGEGLRQYYLQHIHELQLQVRQKTHNLNRLEAQRNELNSKGNHQFWIMKFLVCVQGLWIFLGCFGFSQLSRDGVLSVRISLYANVILFVYSAFHN